MTKTESLLASLGANVLLNNAGQTTQGFKHLRYAMAKMVITSNICIFFILKLVSKSSWITFSLLINPSQTGADIERVIIFCINSLRAMSIARNI